MQRSEYQLVLVSEMVVQHAVRHLGGVRNLPCGQRAETVRGEQTLGDVDEMPPQCARRIRVFVTADGARSTWGHGLIQPEA